MASKTRLEPRLELCVQLGILTGQLNNFKSCSICRPGHKLYGFCVCNMQIRNLKRTEHGRKP